MRLSLFSRALRAPDAGEGDGGGGDSTPAAPTFDRESHVVEADKLFSNEGGGDDAHESEGGGDVKAKADADAKARADADAKGKSEPEKKSPSIFDRKKPQTDAEKAKADADAKAKAEADKNKPADHPEDKLTLGDKASSQTKEQFGELKKITKTLREEIAARDTRLADLEKKASSAGQPPADYEQLKAEHKALSDRLQVLDLQNHPSFRKQYVEPKERKIGELTTILGDSDVKDVDIAGLLGKPRAEFAKAVTEIAGKLNEFDADTFKAEMRSLYQLEGSAKEQLSRAGELGKALRTQMGQQQRQSFDAVWKDMSFEGSGLDALEIPDGAPEAERAALTAYNQAAKGIRASAEKYAFDNADEKTAAEIATKAATFDFITKHAIPRMESEYTALRELNQKLAEELKAVKAARKGSGGGSDAGGGGEKKLHEQSHEEAANALFAGR